MKGLVAKWLVAAFCAGASTVQAEQGSAIGLQSVYVQGASGQWLSEWYEQNLDRFGPLFAPRIQIEDVASITQLLQLDQSSIALLPSSVTLDGTSASLLRVPSGLTACIAAIAKQEGPIKAVGDLHALSGNTRIAVSADVKHLADAVVDIYGLQSKVTLVQADGHASVRALETGEVALAFLSASDGKRVKLPSGTSKSIEVIELPDALVASASTQGFIKGSITDDWLGDYYLRSGHATICDPVDLIASETSRYTNAALSISNGPRILTEDASLLQRTFAALLTLREMQKERVEYSHDR